jgi:hypothetical protein
MTTVPQNSKGGALNLGPSFSSDVQYVTLQKYFSPPSLVVYFLYHLTHKTETGIANRWGTTDSKLPGPMTVMGQRETLKRSQIRFITLFSSKRTPLVCLLVREPQQTVQAQVEFRVW